MKNGKNVKRILAGITAVVLAALPVMSQGGINDEIFSLQEVSAAEENTDLTYGSVFVPSFNTYSMDNDEAFAGYVQNVFYGDSGTSLMQLSRYGRGFTDDEDLEIYNNFKTFVKDVADGENSSAICDVSISVEKFDLFYNDRDQFDNFINSILLSLLYECPYDFYWFDKSIGVKDEISGNSNEGLLRFYFVVSESYRGDNTVIEPPYNQAKLRKLCSVDTEKTSAARTAADNALAVVNDTAGMNTYQRLRYFKDYIIDQVNYAYDVTPDSNTPYGDPWQLIYVFDNDTSTNVVCEGYAKAFKYLCDLSGIQCILVTGGMLDGAHMWNIVTVDDENYMVDVTNCDDNDDERLSQIERAIYRDWVFMKQPSGYIDYGYVYYGQLVYQYDNETMNFFDETELTLSDKEYHGDLNSDGICDNGCGAPFAVVNEVSATLGGKIGLNFYMNLLDNIAEDEGAMIYIYRNGLQVTKEFVRNCKQSDGRYKVTYKVNAKEMHDTISIQLVDGNNKVINLYNTKGQVINSNFEEISGSAASYSVAEYFSYIKDYSDNQKMKDLADAALVYGSEAQKRFDYDTASAADVNDSALEAVTADTLSQYSVSMTGSIPDGLAFDNMSLLLKDETTIRLYFTSENIDNYSFEAEGYTGNPLVKAIGKNYVEISNIPAKDLDKVFNVKIKEKNTAADDECVISVSALSYAFASVTKNTASSSVVKALYLYNKAADNYFSREEN